MRATAGYRVTVDSAGVTTTKVDLPDLATEGPRINDSVFVKGWAAPRVVLVVDHEHGTAGLATHLGVGVQMWAQWADLSWTAP